MEEMSKCDGLWRSRIRGSALVLLFVLTLSACGDDEDADTRDTGVSADTGADVGDAADAGDVGDDVGPGIEHPLSECDSLVEQVCALPWPSNLYLAPDDARATGYTLTFGEASLPQNHLDTHVDPEPFERMDGYGLGVPIMAIFEDVDTSDFAGRYSVERSTEADASIVLLKVDDSGAHERVPYWAELDVHAETTDDQVLFVRPAVVLEPDTRYVVAFRDLQTTGGDSIDASPAFASLRDGDTAADPVLSLRQQRFDEVFNILDEAGVSRQSLTLAWDFVTASSDGLHGRMLRMRDEALETTGQDGPALTVEEVREFAPEDDGSGREIHADIFLEIEGTMEVPHYMRDVGDGFVFNLDDDGRVVQNGTREADFLVRIPHSALEEPARIITYGHGLLGSREEIYAGHLGQLANEYNYVLVAADLAGMSYVEQSAALSSIFDLSNFVKLADRLHQGLLEYILLTRAAGQRLPDLGEITDRDILIDTSEQYYFGGSQGGIFGQTFMALTPDIEHGYLAVPGNNYSTLLYRSTGFAPFHSQMQNTYESAADRAIGIGAMQLLWDGTDPISYARHISAEPFDGEPKKVLMTVAKGDYQVAVVTNEHVARSGIDIPILENYDSERTPWDVEQVSYPHDGSGIVLFDFGNPWPEDGNDISTDGLGDPHSKLSHVPEAGVQLDHFLRTGQIMDVCEGEPCQFDP
jgi:hypothetical protein